jgi:hypothetical protein
MTTAIEETIRRFTQRPFAAVAALLDDDGKGARLLEPGSGKELRVKWDEIAIAEEKQSKERSQPYLLLVFHDGRQVALAEVGFAFAPSTVNTGPLPDLPPVLCFADFRHLAQGVETLLSEDGREKEALAAVMVCIALLDGARAAGLPVDREERRLEGLLRQLEERGLPAA